MVFLAAISPAVVGVPATSNISLIVIGTPWSGPRRVDRDCSSSAARRGSPSLFEKRHYNRVEAAIDLFNADDLGFHHFGSRNLPRDD